MTGISTDADLVAAARSAYRHFHHDDGACKDPKRWAEFTAEHPELAEVVQRPKPNRGIGSGSDMTAGRCWRQSDKQRQYRKPTSALSMLAVADEGLTNNVDEILAASRGDSSTEYARDSDGADPSAELPDEGEDFTADEPGGFHFVSEYEHRSEQTSSRLLEVCVRCGWPLALAWEPACEFPESPMFWFQYFEACHCNGCLSGIKRRPGTQPRYCADGCKRDAANARRRRRRGRAEELPLPDMPVRKCAHCTCLRYAECGRSCLMKCDCGENHTDYSPEDGCLWCRK
ncbi:hypothetical protein [Mycolicibacterium celeriflavum]|uniref:Uncharacterized protein n=1 Tax=Mycolicibacterium celeriflavum TaxID=1249101 RepID=A0A1X0C2Q0_MYCCF|nr:hypothetical protein [Mycolicibacterium celeriflavum]MCV7239560.1 hypothetical protein [Mycolicibacterium celeriflavum]ORA51612.1 hypothetical protein BST21_00565 [Mycolicibacterium celeriflavum]BBY43252.1 hypothetical protein MCEL_15470 [Mycolicibacterium celeriflavum]